LVWVADEIGEFSSGTVQSVRVHPDSMVILASLTGVENLALGRDVVDEFGNGVPLADGSVALVQSEWISGTPNVFGRNFTVDLGVDRAINRIRILPGQSAINQPEYFMRGYQIEAATQQSPKVWHELADEPENFRLTVDTRHDSTWTHVDGQGAPVPRLGRYVRLTLIRQDRSNWVALGEVEVFGVGYASDGFLENTFVPEAPVNVGRIRWQSEQPEGTRIELQVRGKPPGDDPAPWLDLESHTEEQFAFDGEEPVEQFTYRVRLRNDNPAVTPALQRIEVEYDPVLVAQDLRGEVIGPQVITKGIPVELQYRVAARVEEGDYGIDLLRLQGVAIDVEWLRIDGRELNADEGLAGGYRVTSSPAQEETLIELAEAERIKTSATIEFGGQALFLRDRTVVSTGGGSRQQSARDGHMNWQSGREAAFGTWTVLAGGAPLQLLSEVQVTPRPYSPFAGGRLTFDVVVSNIDDGRDLALRFYSLDGRLLRKLVQTGRARAYRFEWDGRDEDGAVVAPGLYLYELGVSRSSAARRGTVAVAY
jgi:hypothetical protein